ADLAIVSNVGVGHDPVVIAHTGHAHILHRTGIDGDVFTNHIAIADFQASRFTSVLLVLRHAADGAETVEMVVATNRGHAIYHAVRAHFGARPYRDIGPNDAVGPDLDIICKLSACSDDGCFMNTHKLFFQLTDSTHNFGFGYHLAIDQGAGCVLAQSAADTVSRHFQTQLIAWHHGLAETRAIHTDQVIGQLVVHFGVRILGIGKREQCGCLSHGFNDQDPRHNRHVRKVARKKGFI